MTFLWLWSLQDERGPAAILFVPPIMASAYLGGLRPALLTTLLAVIASAYLSPPLAALWVLNRLVMLGCVGVAIAATTEALHRARERAEQALRLARAGEERFRRLFFASPIAKALSRIDNRVVVDVNDAFLRTFNCTRESIVGHTPAENGIAPDSRDEGYAALHEQEVQLVAADGTPRTVLVSSQRVELDGEQVALTFFVDLTDHKRAQSEADAAHERLAEIADLIEQSFWVMDMKEQRMLYVSPGYEKIFGRSCDDLLADPQSWVEAIHLEDRAHLLERSQRTDVMTGDSDEFRIVRPDGKVRWVASRVYPVRDDAGQLARLAGVASDITERVEALELAHSSQERFRQLAEAIEEVFWLTDVANQEVLYCSPAYERIWGRPVAEIYASAAAWFSTIHPDDRDAVITATRTKKVLGTYDERYRIVRPNGDVRWIHDKAFPVRNESGEVIRVAGLAQDITERRQLEESMQQKQKLESIGLLAGGVAHDFNNILTVIMGNAEVLAAMLPADFADRELVEEIAVAAERATSLTRQLLAFSRKQVVQPVVLDVNATLDEGRRMLRRILGEDITLLVELDPDAGYVRMDSGQLVQVLMNLCLNARDAMPGGGTITVQTCAATGAVHLVVRDTGTGMSDEVKARAFEPFYTTKEVGKGTGLGLAVVYGIVHEAGGSVEVASTAGAGTVMRVVLPTVVGRRRVRQSQPVAGAEGERILVVDDDAALRASTARILKQRGYAVLEACDGNDALRQLRASAIDLMITDVVMPGMSGRELGERAHREFPRLRMLYTSGYTDDEVVRRGVMQSQVAFLEKPFGLGALASKVRQVLDAR